MAPAAAQSYVFLRLAMKNRTKHIHESVSTNAHKRTHNRQNKVRAQQLCFTTFGQSASSSWNNWAPITNSSSENMKVDWLNTNLNSSMFGTRKIMTKRYELNPKTRIYIRLCWCLTYSVRATAASQPAAQAVFGPGLLGASRKQPSKREQNTPPQMP